MGQVPLPDHKFSAAYPWPSTAATAPHHKRSAPAILGFWMIDAVVHAYR